MAGCLCTRILSIFPWPRYTFSGCGKRRPFASLESVMLTGTSSIKSLPEQIQYLPLRNFCLQNFDGLEALPDWLGNICSLECLLIWDCKNLMRFPSLEAMQRLSKLKEVNILNCPILSEILEQRSGTGWDKISKFHHHLVWKLT